ncbi:hypothetical protein CC2G_011150 [Coprinopsis cinerea AmutBmut pab1-1]|nr:hypothetical protein CC2G_011150 [Coprinopsis cinerea AmutBmut pab1-1]
MPCSILDLPSEILAEVAFHVSNIPNTYPSTLKSCILACKTFADHFRPRLFQCTIIDLGDNAHVLRCLAILNGNPQYGNLVKILVAIGDSQTPIHCPALPDLLLHLKKVNKLMIIELSFPSLPTSISQSMLSFYNTNPLLRLEAYRCDGLPLGFIFNPKLEYIGIFHTSCGSESTMMPADACSDSNSSGEVRLRELVIRRSSENIFTHTQRLLTFASSSLETLRLTPCEPEPFCLNLAGLVRLRHLRLSATSSLPHEARHLVTSLTQSLSQSPSPDPPSPLETISLSFSLDTQNAFMHLTDATADWDKLEGILADRARLPRLRGVNLEFKIVHRYTADPLPDLELCNQRAKERLVSSLEDLGIEIRVCVTVESDL